MTKRRSDSSIHRATKKSLAAHHANFTLDGLKFHFGKLCQYTNPTGGALDKIPMNTKAYLALYFNQFKQYPSNHVFEPAPRIEPQKQKPLFLRKKAQYQVADHLLGIGKKSYWTGSTGQSTLLGLDIDDHDSKNDAEVQANSELAMRLFIEMTGLNPIPCKSPGGINAFLICQKDGMSTHFANETWHSVVRIVNAEANRRGLVAQLECKGKARIFNDKLEYCGVQFKDPLYNSNPTDEQLHEFWEKLEASAVTAIQLHDLLTTHDQKSGAQLEMVKGVASSTISASTDDALLTTYKDHWAKHCRDWAINGLPCKNSLGEVVRELSKWLLFVELWEVDEKDRVQQVADLLFAFVLLKHNGHSTRLNDGRIEEVKSHIQRLGASTVSSMSDAGKAIFAKLRSQQHMKLVPLLQSNSPSAPLSSVKSTECCTVSNWLPAPKYRRKRAEGWNYVPDDTALPETLTAYIASYYKRNEITIHKPTMVKLKRFLNHLWTSKDHEAPLSVEGMRKVMEIGNGTREHIGHLAKIGVITISDGYCPSAGISKKFRLTARTLKMFSESRPEKPADDAE